MENKLPYVSVYWDDPACIAGWFEPGVVHIDNSSNVTRGWISQETEDHIWVSSTLSETEVNCTMQIPKTLIREIKHATLVLGDEVALGEKPDASS